MSGDKLFSTFATKVGASPASGETPEPEGPEDFGAFGWLRGHDRALMLELRFRNGNVIALGYGWLEQVAFDPSDGIVLTFTGQRKIKIVGWNLNTEIRPNVRLFDGLTRHKIPWVEERDERAFDGGERKATIITCIQCECT
jgi:hypothetical protein